MSRALTLFSLLFTSAATAGDFVNFEVAPVHPLDLSPDGRLLAVCQTADNRVLLYSLVAGTPVLTAAIPAGLDPVSVRWRTETEMWVANRTSDTVSVMDASRRVVTQTLQTADEPSDVVFAGAPSRAWVSCSQARKIQTFDPANPAGGVRNELTLEGRDPRALAVSVDGTTVFAAIFTSGNSSTILGGGADLTTVTFPPNAVGDPRGPYGGLNPPPNSGTDFVPAKNPAAGTPPKVGLIVKKNAAGAWYDDNNHDWTPLVSGAISSASGRPPGWDVVDNDVAIIDTATRGVTYAARLMNLCMALGVNPATGKVTLVGTEATNEIRFEPNVKGKFVRVHMGSFDPAAPGIKTITDLNPHLDYSAATVPQAERDKSVGDPRAIVWKADGTRGYVAGMGSNNVAVIDPSGARAGANLIATGQGPAGLALDEARGMLYVLNRFEGSLSVVSLATEKEILRLPFFDPTPPAIKDGRPFLYDTRRTSGLGQAACASCHADARMDMLAWDLGDPSGTVKALSATLHNQGANIPGLNTNFTNFHPMKGPMTTQTMQDIIGKEPHHWRGDRNGLEEFNGAFMSLLGDDVQLTAAEMGQLKAYLATITMPPNPYRNMDNTLPATVSLTGLYTSGRFNPPGQPMPSGNPSRALTTIYRPLSRGIDGGAFACVTCHTLPSGLGTDRKLNGASFTAIPAGPNAERHHALISTDGSSQRTLKVPQLRNLFTKMGFETTQARSLAGFGYAHDGSVDSLSRFLSEGAFNPNNDQEVADLASLMLCFSGSGFGSALDAAEPPGTASQDVPAAVGRQAMLTSASLPATDKTRLDALLVLASATSIDLIAKANVNGVPRGWTYISAGVFQSDQAGVTETVAALLSRAGTSEPVVFTAVPRGSGTRMGIDRDRDGILDYDEIRDLSPALAGIQNPFRSDSADATGNNGSLVPDGIPDGENDFDGDGISNAAEFTAGTNPADNWPSVASLNLAISGSGLNGDMILSWTAEANGIYEVKWSEDMVAWAPLATGPFTAGPEKALMTWTDGGLPDTPAASSATVRRYYTVDRLR